MQSSRDSGKKPLSRTRITERFFIFNRQQGEMALHKFRKQALVDADYLPGSGVERRVANSAARRTGFKNETLEALLLQLF